MYKVVSMGYDIEGVNNLQKWLDVVKDSIEIISVNTTKEGMIFVTYKEIK